MSKHEEQIRKMAQVDCPFPGSPLSGANMENKIKALHFERGYIKGGTAVMENLDIDDVLFRKIIKKNILENQQYSKLKKEILNAITIKEE